MVEGCRPIQQDLKANNPLGYTMARMTASQKMQMIEETLDKLSYYPTAEQLRIALADKISQNEFSTLIKTLIDKNYILIHKGVVFLIHNPELEKYVREHNPTGVCY